MPQRQAGIELNRQADNLSEMQNWHIYNCQLILCSIPHNRKKNLKTLILNVRHDILSAFSRCKITKSISCQLLASATTKNNPAQSLRVPQSIMQSCSPLATHIYTYITHMVYFLHLPTSVTFLLQVACDTMLYRSIWDR